MARNPSFSIIVPTYQRREVVCDTLRALCRIDYDGAVEIIVVVDGSTDGTAEAVAEVECPFPLRVIEQDNRGLAAARNRGAAEAENNILLFLDDDMMSQPDVLSEHASSYAAGADAVLGDIPIESGSRPGFLSDTIGSWKTSERRPVTKTPFDVFGGHLSIRRSVFEEIGGFDESFTAGGTYGNEDIDFGARLLRHHRVLHNPRAISRQRNLIRPRQYMRRARAFAKADIDFASKHPELGEELFERRGASRVNKRLRLLCKIPLVPAAFAASSAIIAELALHTPLRSSRKLSWLFHAGYALSYWSAVRRGRQGGRL